MAKKIAGVLIALVAFAAAVLCLALWHNKSTSDELLEQLECPSYYDQFLFMGGTNIPALLEKVTASENQTKDSVGDFLSYDGTVLIPYLPNCKEMDSVVVNGHLIFISYCPAQPDECTLVTLTCHDGQVVTVTTMWGIWGKGEIYAQVDLGMRTVQIY